MVETHFVLSLLTTVIMTGSIKLFQHIQKFHQIVGIHSSQSNQKQWSAILGKTIFLISSAQLTFTIVAFLLFDAKSMFDYGLAFYILIALINNTGNYLFFIWRSENTFKFIENCVGFIEKRK